MMKPIKTTLILIFALSVFKIATAQEKYSTVKIYVPDDKIKKAELIGLLQIDHFFMNDGAIISEISESDLVKLKASPYRYEILVDDVAGTIKEKNKKYYAERANGTLPVQNRMAFEQTGKTIGNIIPTPAAFEVKTTFGGYYSFAEMNAAMNNLVTAYPSLVQKTSLGTSVEGRDIWCIKISDNAATDELNEPEILYMGLQHAREAIGGSSMIFFMQYLCENYATDTKVKDLVDNREIFIIPCMNPDGWEYNRSTNPNGGGGWRKNRSKVDSTVKANGTVTGYTYGVDLNRNWGVDWGNCSGASSSCGSSTPSGDTYYGDSAFSEPETRAVRAFVQSHHLVASIDQHAYGPYYSLPFGRPTLHPGADSLTLMDQQYYTRIPAMMGNYNGMRAGNSIQSVGYEVAGGIKDWLLKGNIGTGTKGKVFGMTGEGGAGGGTGGSYGSFWAPASQIINLCKGMCFQNLQLAYAAGSYVDLQDVSDISLSAKTGAFDFKIRRIGLEDKPVKISVIPLQNITSVGAMVTINSLPNYYDTYNGSINYTLPAALTAGQRIKFAWKIQTAGYTWYDTITKFYNPSVLFSDNMEGGNVNTNWTVSGGWNYSTDNAYTGSNSLTESPGGKYSASSQKLATYKTPFDLINATAAYISFWTKHRAENFQDYMQVQVSTDGVAWTAIKGSTTIQEPGTLDGNNINGKPSLTGVKDDWTRELFDLSAYLGSSAVSLRFEFVSDAASSFYYSEDDGFYIDDLKIIKSTAPMITLPVHFISFKGRLLPDESVRLDWQAQTDQHHDYFEIEKSANGSNFISIGTGPSSAPYWDIDPSPYIGNNFYRIKQVDKDGTITYSHTVSINYNPEKVKVSVYPNPVTDMLNVKINSTAIDQYSISIADLAGRKVYEEKIAAGQTVREININLKQKAAQLYILTIRNSKNEIVTTQKVVKK